VSDPLRTLWDALEAHGCRPHGKEFDFRSRCPGHGGENAESLKVTIGADGRAVLWCHAHQCEVETITQAIGLSVQDLFPAGHYRARTLASRPVKRSDFSGPAFNVANVLYALEMVERPWTLMLRADCPYCGSQGASLLVRSRGHVLPNGLLDEHGETDVDCPSGCGSREYTQALLGALRKENDA
jgi:hypothetical protein